MAAGFGPVRQAAFGATLHFDSVSTSAAPYYVDITTTNYLQQYGITLVNNTPGTTVKILCANSSYNNSCTGGSGAIVAPSSPNVLIQDGSNGESYTLQFSSPLSTLSFTRAGFNPGPTGLVVAKWSATAFGAQGNALGGAGEDLTAYFTTTAPKVFTLNGPGITSVTFYANGQGVAAVSLPIDNLSSPDLAPVGTSAVTVVDDVTSTQSGFANGTCSTPPAVTVFPASSAFVYLYFDVTGAAVGDVASVNFYEPDGTLYASDSWQPITGTGPNGSECYYDGLSVSGAAAASYPGLWRASVFWDNSSTPLFSLTFTITSVSQTAPSISPGGITNAAGTANPSAPVAPGSIVSIYGTNFVPGATTNGQSGGIPLPTTLDGVQVTMNGIAAPLFYVNSFQINALVPWELSGSSSMRVEVMAGGVASNSANMDLAVTAPGIFAITDAKGNLVTASNPAAPGEYLVIYCTGLGAVSNPPASGAGAPSSPLSETTDATTVTIGGVPAQVSYSGLTPGFAGLYQVNVQVPQEPASTAAPLALSVGTGTATEDIPVVSSGTPAPGSIGIVSLSTTQADPFTILTITGSGFDATHSAISVLFTPAGGGPAIAVPVVSARSTSLDVPVPILPGPAGNLTGGAATIQVVQFDGVTLSTSNVMTGFQVNPPAAIPAGVGTGVVTRAFLNSTLAIVQTVIGAASGDPNLADLVASLNAYASAVNALLPAINTIANDPSQVVVVPSGSGTVSLNGSILAISDQLIWAYVNTFVNQAGGVPLQAGKDRGLASVNEPEGARGSVSANPDCSIPQIGPLICQQYQYQVQTIATINQIGDTVQKLSEIAFGFVASGLGGWATEAYEFGPAAEFAFEQAVDFDSSHIAAWLTDGKQPSLCDSLQDALVSVVDKFALQDKGILSLTEDSYELSGREATFLPCSSGSGPDGGVILAGSQSGAPQGSTILNAFTTSGGQATVTALAAPASQQSNPASAVTVAVPPVDPSTRVGISVVMAGTGSGTVAADPAGYSYSPNTVVTLTAAPDSTSSFAGWGGDCSGTGACALEMDGDKLVVANFEQAAVQQFTLTLVSSPGAGGTVSVGPGSPPGASCGPGCLSYPAGTVVTLAEAPNAGWTFAGWSGGGCSGTGNCTVTMNSDVTVTAYFSQQVGGTGGTPSLSLQIPYEDPTLSFAQSFTGCIGGMDGQQGTMVDTENAVAWGGEVFSGYTWTVTPGTTLPAGVALDPFGFISGNGSPAVPGDYPFSLTVSDSTGAEATAQFDIQFSQAPCGSVVFQQVTSPLPNAVPLEVYAAQLPIAVGPRAKLPLHWSLAAGGALPPGLVLDQATGVIRGTPLASGAGQTFNFAIVVTDGSSPPQTASPAVASTGIYSIQVVSSP